MSCFFRTIISIFIFVIISACTPSTAGGVRALDASKQRSFDVEQNYQKVYRTLLEQMRYCDQANMLTANMQIDGDLYNDIKTGTISQTLVGIGYTNVYQVIDVKEISELNSNVKIFVSLGNPDIYANRIKGWIIDNKKDCS
jgi:hypothetical protein